MPFDILGFMNVISLIVPWQWVWLKRRFCFRSKTSNRYFYNWCLLIFWFYFNLNFFLYFYGNKLYLANWEWALDVGQKDTNQSINLDLQISPYKQMYVCMNVIQSDFIFWYTRGHCRIFFRFFFLSPWSFTESSHRYNESSECPCNVTGKTILKTTQIPKI